MVIWGDYLIALVFPFQIIYVNLKTMSTVLILPASKSETWRRGRCSSRLPNLASQVGLGIVGVTHCLGEERSVESSVFVCQQHVCFWIPLCPDSVAEITSCGLACQAH